MLRVSHLSTAQTTTTNSPSNPKRGHLYFVNQGTFLFWLDTTHFQFIWGDRILSFCVAAQTRSGANQTDKMRRSYLAQYSMEPIMTKDNTKFWAQAVPFQKIVAA